MLIHSSERLDDPWSSSDRGEGYQSPPKKSRNPAATASKCSRNNRTVILTPGFCAAARLHQASYELKEVRSRPLCLENPQMVLVWNASNGSPSRRACLYEHAGIARFDNASRDEKEHAHGSIT